MQDDPFAAWLEMSEDGCAYLVQNGHLKPCGRPARKGSSYCREHHEVCHLAPGSLAETRKLRVIARIAATREARIPHEILPKPAVIDELDRWFNGDEKAPTACAEVE